VREHLERLGVAHRFLFTGFRADAVELLAGFDVFVLSTHWEGLPLVLLEAAVHSRPIVATAVDGIPEVIVHGQTGLTYPARQDRMLADHLCLLARSPALAAELGARARSHVERQFSPSRFADSLDQLYRGLLAR
jgi:glycosyltransferase involved in cell wall biosynthesis